MSEAIETTTPAGEDEAAAEAKDRALSPEVTTWPHLVRIEMLWTLAAMVIVTVWSIAVNAPLEAPANPTVTPDPSKAPWYFLGLQELLVYFDPWIAGVAVPLLIIFGLCVIPYVDPNPKGNGYYCLSDRPFAISVFLFGFVGLWTIPLLIGTFCRGPGWNWYWPWESWEIPKTPSMTNLNLTDLLGVPDGWAAIVVGGAIVALWYGLGGIYYWWARKTPFVRSLGGWRYALVASLLLTMLAIPVKMVLRLALNVKYVWATPWFNI